MTEKFSIGVDLGGTNLRIAAYCGDQGYLETKTLSTRLLAGREEVVRDMCEAVDALIVQGYGDRKLASIAVGIRSSLVGSLNLLHCGFNRDVIGCAQRSPGELLCMLM
jgi:predicted NBD/HSP70 family sugar kinase